MRQKIAEQDEARGRPLTSTEKLRCVAIRCDTCEMNWPYCAWYGCQLMEPDERANRPATIGR